MPESEPARKKSVWHLKHKTSSNLLFMLLGIPMALFVSMVLPREAISITGVVLIIGGFILMLIARFSEIWQGRWVRKMTEKNRIFFRVGYALVVFACLLTVALGVRR